MLKNISAMKVRQSLGQVINEVALRGDDYIVERAGKPLVAIIPMEKYERLQRDREAALQALNLVPDDPKDDMVLACAVEGRADFIVSEDSHLLDLKAFQGILIVAPATFLGLTAKAE